MQLGVHISKFTWAGGPSKIAQDLKRVAQTADEAGFAKLSVMDHVWQIGHIGPPELDMLEAYTTLGFLAANTSRIDLLAWVTAVVYREPGLVAKQVTTLDVLSGGRAWLGIGAAWNVDEARGLGLSFPSTAERFERLEEALQICLQMWSDDDSSYDGRHYQLARTLNSPQSVRRPRPPILIGGGGEKKTLRLVAKYADACNLFASPELEADPRDCSICDPLRHLQDRRAARRTDAGRALGPGHGVHGSARPREHRLLGGAGPVGRHHVGDGGRRDRGAAAPARRRLAGP